MNEKIKLFAKQAEQYALDKANEGNDEDYDYSFDDDFQEKFAELIVRECIEVIDTTSDNTKLMWVDPYQKIIWAIEQHFGVEL
jgi:hypothetical protein